MLHPIAIAALRRWNDHPRALDDTALAELHRASRRLSSVGAPEIARATASILHVERFLRDVAGDERSAVQLLSVYFDGVRPKIAIDPEPPCWEITSLDRAAL